MRASPDAHHRLLQTTPLTPPLLPLLTKLNTQITLLTQPRHIDSISRRLKLLLSDLDRVAAHPGKRAGQTGSGHAHSSSNSGSLPPATHSEQLGPLITRLGPVLPQIPHLLARLRTLAALHTAAGDFERTLGTLEAEQRRERAALEELSAAVGDVEKSLETNRALVEGNVKGLEERVGNVAGRLEKLEA
jgi:nuclear migration protein JNM1